MSEKRTISSSTRRQRYLKWQSGGNRLNSNCVFVDRGGNVKKHVHCVIERNAEKVQQVRHIMVKPPLPGSQVPFSSMLSVCSAILRSCGATATLDGLKEYMPHPSDKSLFRVQQQLRYLLQQLFLKSFKVQPLTSLSRAREGIISLKSSAAAAD